MSQAPNLGLRECWPDKHMNLETTLWYVMRWGLNLALKGGKGPGVTRGGKGRREMEEAASAPATQLGGDRGSLEPGEGGQARSPQVW